MAPIDIKSGNAQGPPQASAASLSQAKYQLTLVEEPFVITSLLQGLREWLSSPKNTVPKKYFRGEATLPIVEMRPWYRDIPDQVRALLEKRDLTKVPDPVRGRILYNQKQERRRGLVAAIGAAAGAVLAYFLGGLEGAAVGLPVGYLIGYLIAVYALPKVEEYPDIWRHYPQQPASWFNSLLVHALALTALILPYVIRRMLQPKKALATAAVVDISPYLPDLVGPAKKTGGGGGGGDRSPTPASKGAVPKFAKEQLAPPMARIENLTPKMPVQPTLLGPPQLKLPQMQASVWGDPLGVLGPASNGPGTGGGIGTGEGTGIGPGKGGGLGPGEGGGAGGGVYSVGGGVSPPIPIYKPEPPYSEEARKAKYQGVVVLSIVVDAQGGVDDVRVVKPLGLGLDEKAEETVKTWKFKPALRNGLPVPVRVLVEVTFRLF
jgi:TonB family protein